MLNFPFVISTSIADWTEERLSSDCPSVLQADIVVKKDQVLPVLESSLRNADDLISLDELNQPVILHNFRERYLNNDIYVRQPLCLH